MDKALFMKTVLEAFDKMNERELDGLMTSVKTEVREKPRSNYTAKALDFLYNRDYDKIHEEFFSSIVHAELNRYRFYQYQWDRTEGLYVREVIASVCDLLDKGMTLREITNQLELHFDTVCRIRAFFEEEH